MTRAQIAQLRGRLDTMERLLVELTAELKAIRKRLQAAAAATPAELRR